MGNRLIYETVRTSKTVNAMTDFQFRCWTYLITYVDDYGRGSADAEILKGFVFPRQKRVRESDIDRTLAELAGIGAIRLYEVDGEPFFCFPHWSDHQRIQTKKSKFPPPPENLHRESPCVTVNHGNPPPESNPIQSEYESEYESNMSGASPAPDRQPAIELMLNDKSMYPVYQEDVDEWAKLYPAVDIMQELRKMVGWCNANPSKRKTKSGVNRFINSWLSSEQDKGGARGGGNRQANGGDSAAEHKYSNVV